MAWPALLVHGFGLLSDYLSDKREAKNQDRKHDRDMKAKEQKRELDSDNQAGYLDAQSIASRGWKDDWLLFITTLPLAVMVFEPILLALFSGNYVAGDATRGVEKAFEALGKAPEYYWWALGLIYIDTFGFRRMLRVAVQNYFKKRFN